MRAVYSLFIGTVVGALCACNQSPIETPVRSFDRPSDVALTCVLFNPLNSLGKDAAGNIVGSYEPRPLSACAPLASTQVEQSAPDPATGLPYEPVLRALVVNSARGEVALVDVPQEILVDLDRANPGFNFIPVGRLPESIRASKDGCLAVTANVDSCDLAVLNLTVMYNMPFVPNLVGQSRAYSKDVVHRIQLTAGGVPVEARPTSIELVPTSTNQATCADRTYKAWVALPGCEAVVETELKLGTGADPIQAEITRAIRVTRSGATLLSDPTQLACPAECTGGSAPGDAGAPVTPDGGVRLPETQAAPGTIALDLEDQTMRLVIGDLYGERITIVPLDATNGDPQAPRSVQLEAGALGVARVRVSPRSPAGKFVYAMARDNSVHVVDLDLERECETNPDPTELGAVPPEDPLPDARRLGCLPLGDPTTPRRSPNATGPGITLPNGAIPRDVAFVHLDTPLPPETGAPLSAQPQLLVGDFAWIIGSDGRAQVVNVFDACPQPNDPQLPDGVNYTPACSVAANAGPSRIADIVNNFGNPYPYELERVSHRIRSGLRRFLQPNSAADSAGTPRVSDPQNPVTITVAGSPANAQAGFRLPTLKQVERTITNLTKDGATGQAFMTIDVPDPMRARDETWSLSWEGVLPGTLRAYGKVCAQGDASCPRGSLVDAGATYCGRDVRPGDKLELVGCDTDADCRYTQLCVRDPAAPVGVIHGLCLDRNDDGNDPVDGLTERCSPLLRAQRRYRISAPRQGVTLPNGDVTDLLELAEIYEPEFASQTHACTVDADCADVLVPAPDLLLQRPPLSTSCLRDSDGANRCLRKCDPTTNDTAGLCGDGYLCAATQTSTAAAPDFRCMRAPLDVGLFTDCLRLEQRYQVRAGGAFLVTGGSSGLLTDLEPNPVSRTCETPPVSDERVRLRSPRIPLEAPLCPQQVDASLGIDELSWVGAGGPNACRLGTGDDRVYHFENPIFSFALQLPKNPTGYVPEDDTVVSFVVVGGGFALGLVLGVPGDPAAQAPKSVAVAPDKQTVFVVDEGKGTASTSLRGQLLRLVSALQLVDQTFRVR